MSTVVTSTTCYYSRTLRLYSVLPLVDSGNLNKPNVIALLHMLSDQHLPLFKCLIYCNGRINFSISNFQCKANDCINKLACKLDRINVSCYSRKYASFEYPIIGKNQPEVRMRTYHLSVFRTTVPN